MQPTQSLIMPPRIPLITFSHLTHTVFAKNCVRTAPLSCSFASTPKHHQDDQSDSANSPPSPVPRALKPNDPSSFIPPSDLNTTLNDQTANYANQPTAQNFSSPVIPTTNANANTSATINNVTNTNARTTAIPSTTGPNISRILVREQTVPAYRPAPNPGNQNYPSGYSPASPGGGGSGFSGGYNNGYYGGGYGGANSNSQASYPSAAQQQPAPPSPYSTPISLFSSASSRGNPNASASASGLSDMDNEELFRSQRRFRHGEMYTPKDLSFESFREWRKRRAPRKDAFDVLGLNPLDEYKVSSPPSLSIPFPSLGRKIKRKKENKRKRKRKKNVPIFPK